MSKKGLALTLATLMIWAVAVPAFSAAEPFPDVPQDHWAYEAIEMLRVAGLVEGYPDGTFGGERTFTRYEMAMVFSRILERLVAWLEGREALIITPAMGGTITALGREFGPELALLDVRVGELERLMGQITARTESLEEQVAALLGAATAAQEAAEAAADAASRAEDRAYRARLATEQARAQAGEAAAVANRALALAGMSDGLEGLDDDAMTAYEAAEAARLAAQRAQRLAADAESTAMRALAVAERSFEAQDSDDADAAEAARQAAQRAQRLAADAESTAMRALAVAEMGFASDDASKALAEAETASERAYRARLAAQQARALANEAREIAERGLAIAEMAYESEDAKQAAEAAEQAADRAYRARLAAEDARAQARDAREVAERALAIAELAGPGALDEAVAAQTAVEQARLSAQRAQRLAADAESAAMIADAKGDLARQEAANSMAVAREAHDLASDAMNEAFRQGELARAEAREALDAARQADRLAYLAHLSAERALSRIDELADEVAELKARPVFGGEVRADFEETHSNNADGLLDPRGPSNGPKIGTIQRSVFTTSVALNATVEPAEDVVVKGGLKLSADVFGSSTQDINLADLFVSVTTPGTVRSAYFGSVTGAQLAEGFSKYTIHPARYNDLVSAANRGGAVVETQLGGLNARFIASRTNTENVYGVASTIPLADGLNVGFNYVMQSEVERSTALRLFGETAGLGYDWTYASFADDVAIDGELSTTIGSIELGFDYHSVGDGFGNNTHLGKDLTYKDDHIVAGRTASTLSATMPLSIGKAVYERGRDADLADPDDDFTNHQLVGLEDVDFLGFDVAGYFYTDDRDHDRKTQGSRFDVSRTVQLGLPLKFSFTQANMNLTNWVDPAWPSRSYQAIGVSLDEYALNDALTLNAGYIQETRPLDVDGDWKDPEDWILELEDDAAAKFVVETRNTLSASLSLAASESLTLSGGYALAQHTTDNGDFTQGKTDLGADYTLSMYGADITLGYGYQVLSYSGAYDDSDASPRTTYSVAVTRDVWGATMDASYKLVTGRGSDAQGKKDARDMMAAVDFTYPVADGMDFTLNGKWGSSSDNGNAADDYYYASVKAGVGLKF